MMPTPGATPMLPLLIALQAAALSPAQDGPFRLTPFAPPRPVVLEPAAAEPGDHVLLWNDAALDAIRTEKTPPPIAARNLAVVHAAMFDAVNAVTRTHQAYLTDSAAPAGTAPELAAGIAAHRALVGLYPKHTDRLDALLRECCAGVADGPGKTAAVALGQATAEKLLARVDVTPRRSGYAPRDEPGRWRPTPPEFAAPLLPDWPASPCFCMRRGDQFRPPPPPSLTTREYATAFAEVRQLGAKASADRTRDETEYARFWADGPGTVTPPGHWNRIAADIARKRGGTLVENARLFALLNLALADAGIACWDAKYHYDFWRPVTAIRAETDPAWEPLLPTPPFPAYSSGHSTFSAAAAAVLAAEFGDEFEFTSTSDGLPGVARSYRSFSGAAAEAGRSRIVGGIHWEFDNAEGLKCGRQVGEYVASRFLRPRRD